MTSDVHLVVPTLGDRPEMLDLSVSSIKEQTYPCRVTIVVGGATEAVKSRFRGVRGVSIVRQRGRGLSAAINQAWSEDEWRSELTGWLGDDDALPPWSVATAVETLLSRPDASMVHGKCLVIDESGGAVRILRGGRLAAALAGYGMNLIAQPGSLFRTRLVREIGGLDESLRYSMDVDLYTRLRRKGPIASSGRQLGVFRAHAGGLSTASRIAAAAEVRAAQARAHASATARTAAILAEPATRVIWRLTQLPTHAKHSYWAPNVIASAAGLLEG